VAIASQGHGKHVSAAMNKQTTIEEAVFSVWPVLGNGSVSTYPWQ
jgi:hypothetical protein